jgi:hypothetical protein
MNGSGVLSKLVKQGSILLALDLLNHLTNKKLNKKRIELVLQIGDIWVLASIIAPRCCVQFYKLEGNDNFKIRDHILRISCTRHVAHMFC